MNRNCIDCLRLVEKKNPGRRCWKCKHQHYLTPAGTHGPHHCNYCGESGHNIITCKDRRRSQ